MEWIYGYAVRIHSRGPCQDICRPEAVLPLKGLTQLEALFR